MLVTARRKRVPSESSDHSRELLDLAVVVTLGSALPAGERRKVFDVCLWATQWKGFTSHIGRLDSRHLNLAPRWGARYLHHDRWKVYLS